MKKFFAFIGITVLFAFTVSIVKKIAGNMKKAHNRKTAQTA
jgi:hypothetical protein